MRGSYRARRLVAGLLAVALCAAASAVQAADLVSLSPHPPGLPWPTADWPGGELPPDLDREAFDAAIEELFASRGRGGFANTRAVLFVQQGRIVYERYAEGFGRASRFQSWSMAKSVTNAFVGLLVGDGRLGLDAPADIVEWQDDGDPRSQITLRHMLQMRTGLANSDGFGSGDLTRAFISRLVFGEGSRSPAAFAARVELDYPVGEHWNYSTGTSILLASLAGKQVGSSSLATRDFLRDRLFAPLGMLSAQPEFAKSGEFMGGVFVHANARDWARFGYLYLRDGVWDGQRLLPEGWVDFSRTPSPAANNGIYAAHFWANRPPAEEQWEMLPGAPDAIFAAEGASFQMVAMSPTQDLVAVRLGEIHGVDFQEVRKIFARAVAVFPEVAP